MAGGATTGELETLIDEGLVRYRRGDFDGAMSSWRRAAELEPGDARVRGYLDYLRTNYQLLIAGAAGAQAELAVPFGLEIIEESDGYDLELTGGDDLGLQASAVAVPSVDDGWALEDAVAESKNEVGDATTKFPLIPGTSPSLSPFDEDDEFASFELSGVLDDEPAPLPVSTTNAATVPGLPSGQALLDGPGLVDGPGFSDEFGPSPSVADDFEGGELTREVRRELGFVRPTPAVDDVMPAARAARTASREGTPTLDPYAGDGLERPTLELAMSRAELRSEVPPAARTRESRESGSFGELAPFDAPSPRRGDLDTIDEEVGDLGFDEMALAGDARLTMDEIETPDPTGTARSRPEARMAPPVEDLGLVQRDASAMSADQVAEELLAEIDRAIPKLGTEANRLRARVSALLDRAEQEHQRSQHTTAAIALDLALSQDPDSAVAQKLVHARHNRIIAIYESFIGDRSMCPRVAVSPRELSAADLDSRVAFLLSRIDGTLSFEELLDVAGMARLEAYRHLARLVLRGLVEVA